MIKDVPGGLFVPSQQQPGQPHHKTQTKPQAEDAF